MKGISIAFIAVAVLSLVVGIYSRLSLNVIIGLESRVYAGFSVILLLFSIAINTLSDRD